MLYHLLYYLVDDFSPLNVTRYLTFRAIVSLLSALFISIFCAPWFIQRLRSKQIGQVVRDDGPKSHFSKAGTPTMGGSLIIFAVVFPTLLWMDWKNHFVWCSIFIMLGNSLLGYVDDYRKVKRKNSKGVPGRVKLFWQVIIAFVALAFHYWYAGESGIVHFPFFKNLHLDLGLLYFPFALFVIVGASNAVNLTDGLDGLAIGPVMIASACFAILTYVSGHAGIAHYLNIPHIAGSGELAIFAAAIVGAGMGFLWYNTYPAQVFMGDVGSLPLGAALGTIAVFSKHEILLAIIGGVFVLEAVSVISQVASFKLTGKRIFRMAPIHHHFELKGWPEPKVIVRFWIISMVLALVGLLSLKIR